MIRAYKQEGETMGGLLVRIRKEQNFSADLSMTYAGRLDPMAEGEVMVLMGEECKDASKHWYHPKRYETEILLGVSTDTADVLGLVQEVRMHELAHPHIQRVVENTKGPFVIPYPAYSSKPVEGKPLWQWSREGQRPHDWPQVSGEVFEVSVGVQKTRTLKELSIVALERIKKVQGDFRQEAITAKWKEVLEMKGEGILVDVAWHVSGGTYIRSLAEEIGKKLGVPACAWRIVRTVIHE